MSDIRVIGLSTDTTLSHCLRVPKKGRRYLGDIDIVLTHGMVHSAGSRRLFLPPTIYNISVSLINLHRDSPGL